MRPELWHIVPELLIMSKAVQPVALKKRIIFLLQHTSFIGTTFSDSAVRPNWHDTGQRMVLWCNG